jgi:hypothetical protein
MRGGHRRRELEFAKRRPNKIAQPFRLEISPGDPFCFKHRDLKITEAPR